MKTVLIDANVLLNGVYAPASLSRRVLVCVMESRLRGMVLENTLDECHSVIARAEKLTGRELWSGFWTTFLGLRLMSVPRVPSAIGARAVGVKGLADRVLAAKAMELGVVVCTNNLGDFAAAGVGVSPAEIVRGLDSNSLASVVHGFFISRREGTLLVRFRPQWADVGEPAPGRYTLLDVEGLGALFYEAPAMKLVFDGEEGPRVVAELPVAPRGGHFGAAVSYHSDRGISLFTFGRSSGSSEARRAWSPSSAPTGRAYLHRRDGTGQAGGWFDFVSGLPIAHSRKGCRNVLVGRTVPGQWDRCSLEFLVAGIQT